MNRFSEFMLPPQKSTLAEYTDALFNFVNVTSLILLAGITFAIIYFAWKYRRRSEHDVTPVITHNNKLEITWSVIPLILVMIVFGWGLNGYMQLTTPPSDAYEIRVVGKSWLWEFHYETGFVSVNELHVPANRPVKLVMSSDDVLHSFYIPDFRIKKDVLPNRYTSLWFEATQIGESVIFCTEYCGTAHSNMLARAYVHSPEDFTTWLETAGSADDDLPAAELGEQLVVRNACNTCHSADGTRLVGPSFQGLWMGEREMQDGAVITADENYIRESILEPNANITAGFQPVMPSYAGTLNDRQIDAIIEYIKTLQ
jgi:cytochrome c oxidase subunit II